MPQRPKKLLDQVRDAKEGKDRATILPNNLFKPLCVQLATTKLLHNLDLVDGYGAVYLPYALERKYPHANKELHRNSVYIFHRLRSTENGFMSTSFRVLYKGTWW